MKYCTVCKAKYEDSVSFCPLDGEVLEDDPSSIVDTVLDGQYQIEAMLGKGGMGAVYQARHILLGDRVAIKILPPEMRNNAEWLRRFRREGQAARRFRHPNAVTVYDLRTAGDGTIYMVMEYVDGHTLDAEMKKRGQFTPAEALETLDPIMSVLNAAHSMGVVHRDLKPENIMIGRASKGSEPAVKLLDLGIAKMSEVAGVDSSGTTALTMAGQMLGTPYYMSPEQWGELPRDGSSEIDGRADIYSLALVFYEMIAGRRPYSGLTLQELRREHVSVTTRPIHEIEPSVPLGFSEAISRAMAKDRGDRQPTVGDLASELRASLGGSAQDSAVMSRFARDVTESEPKVRDVATVQIPKGFETKSDVNAATIITRDSSSTAPPVSAQPPPTRETQGGVPPVQPPAPQAFQPVLAPPRSAVMDPVAADAADMASSMTIPQTPKPVGVARQAVTPAPHRSSVFPIVVVVGLLIVIAVGLGGYFAFNWMKKPSDNSTGSTSGTTNRSAGGSNGTGKAATAKEFARYWLEIASEVANGQSVRVAGVVPLASGQSFKFHLVPSEDGYLYIIGPGEQNVSTAFLTAKPASIAGVESNQVKRGVDFSFPAGKENWLKLDKSPGTENYTFIFSRTLLPAPEFLNQEVTGRPLTATEQEELTGFLEKYRANAPATELDDRNTAEPFVAAKLPAATVSGEPVVFAVRIQHK